jgi:hypothetical protein
MRTEERKIRRELCWAIVHILAMAMSAIVCVVSAIQEDWTKATFFLLVFGLCWLGEKR